MAEHMHGGREATREPEISPREAWGLDQEEQEA